MKIVEERYPTYAEIKEMLAAKTGEAELGYEQKNTLEYMEKFAALDVKESKALRKELVDAGLPEKIATLCVNLQPRKEDEVKLILLYGNVEDDAKGEKAKEILKIIKGASAK